MGNTFSAPTSMPATAPLNGDGKICDAAFSHCVRAASVIMARANAADNSIGVVWHLHEIDNTHTDAGFNQFQLSTQTWRWWRGIQVGHPGANDGRDQWNPALDPASDGSYLMTWYDKRNDPLFANNGNSYQVFAVRTNGDGTPIDASDTVIYNASAAANLTLLPAVGDKNPIRYMGEYQDVWEWYGTWYGATTYLDANGQQDIYVMRIGQ